MLVHESVLTDLKAEVERLTRERDEAREGAVRELKGLRAARNERFETMKRAYEEAQKQADQWSIRAGTAEAEAARRREALVLILRSGHDLPSSLFEPMDDGRSVVDIANAALKNKE